MPNPDPLSRDILLPEPVLSIVGSPRAVIRRRLDDMMAASPLPEWSAERFERDCALLAAFALTMFPVGTATTTVAPGLGVRGHAQIDLGPPEAWGEWEKARCRRR